MRTVRFYATRVGGYSCFAAGTIVSLAVAVISLCALCATVRVIYFLAGMDKPLSVLWKMYAGHIFAILDATRTKPEGISFMQFNADVSAFT